MRAGEIADDYAALAKAYARLHRGVEDALARFIGPLASMEVTNPNLTDEARRQAKHWLRQPKNMAGHAAIILRDSLRYADKSCPPELGYGATAGSDQVGPD